MPGGWALSPSIQVASVMPPSTKPTAGPRAEAPKKSPRAVFTEALPSYTSSMKDGPTVKRGDAPMPRMICATMKSAYSSPPLVMTLSHCSSLTSPPLLVALPLALTPTATGVGAGAGAGAGARPSCAEGEHVCTVCSGTPYVPCASCGAPYINDPRAKSARPTVSTASLLEKKARAHITQPEHQQQHELAIEAAKVRKGASVRPIGPRLALLCPPSIGTQAKRCRRPVGARNARGADICGPSPSSNEIEGLLSPRSRLALLSSSAAMRVPASSSRMPRASACGRRLRCAAAMASAMTVPATAAAKS
mmetsp:Transcript_11720/g.49347  ORF Transcript_11720/g.49347 Transcript_11720/m.49347 type:complete len:306 (+) Transcript_11720:1789-2706(+)